MKIGRNRCRMVSVALPITFSQIADGGILEPQKVGLTTKFNKMSEVSKTTEKPAIGNVLLADSAISAIKKDINQLRETLDMIEWCIEGNSNNVDLYVTDVIPSAQDVVKHFR